MSRKPTWHRLIPWNVLKRWYALGRRRWFAAPRPEGIYYRVDDVVLAGPSDETAQRTADWIETKLGSAHSYAPNWEFSYYKRGEILNLARVVYEPSPEQPDLEWWQAHVRGWPVRERPGAIDLQAHWETEPTEHPDAHLDGVGMDVGYGMDLLARHLDDVGIEFEEVEYERV